MRMQILSRFLGAVRGLVGLRDAADTTTGIAISHGWARTAAAESLEAGGFMTIANRESRPDRLLAARSPIATAIQIQGIKVVGTETRMRKFENGLGLPAGATIELRPHGYHLLFQGLRAPMVPGQNVPVTLTFEGAGERHVTLLVKAHGPVGGDVLGSGADATR